MKLVRYGARGYEKPGLIDSDGNVRDLSGTIEDIGPEQLSASSLSFLRFCDQAALPLISGTPRFGCPIAQVGKLIAIGLNYSDHAVEAGSPLPDEPIIFLKATSCIQGPDDDVMLPKGSTKADWEVELGVVIGTTSRYVRKEDALSRVAGYCIVNDVSEREYQLERGGTWDKGKGCDTFGPIGPWLVTTDEITNPQGLNLWLELNGHRVQDGHTRNMIFGVAELISYASRFMTLLPGDIITTGTPAGVGLGMRPPTYLKAGDTMALGVTGLGRQHQRVVPFSL
jgi:2-keto-4-pentenoate hydratase/2-oxohepta-3-ene-1,7-dioic acid hydratase in catechol pathway